MYTRKGGLRRAHESEVPVILKSAMGMSAFHTSYIQRVEQENNPTENLDCHTNWLNACHGPLTTVIRERNVSELTIYHSSRFKSRGRSLDKGNHYWREIEEPICWGLSSKISRVSSRSLCMLLFVPGPWCWQIDTVIASESLSSKFKLPGSPSLQLVYLLDVV